MIKDRPETYSVKKSIVSFNPQILRPHILKFCLHYWRYREYHQLTKSSFIVREIILVCMNIFSIHLLLELTFKTGKDVTQQLIMGSTKPFLLISQTISQYYIHISICKSYTVIDES